MSRVLVVGGAGFLGAHLCNNLVTEGHYVVAFDNLSGGKTSNLSHDVKFIKGDMRDLNALRMVFSLCEFDVVYLLAALPHEGLSVFCPAQIMDNNVTGSLNVLTTALTYHVPRFVFFSSMARYGKGDGESKPPFKENSVPTPVDPYGHSKYQFEKLLELYSKQYDFKYRILVPHNFYGPLQNMSDPYRNVVTIFINRLLQNKPLYIYGDGEQLRSFSYVDDSISSMIKMGISDDENLDNQVINIGPTGNEISIKQLANKISKLMKSNLKHIHIKDRPCEVKHAYCTNDKAEKLLGFKESVKFNEGLKRTIKWCESQGPKQFNYWTSFELINNDIPTTWSERLL